MFAVSPSNPLHSCYITSGAVAVAVESPESPECVDMGIDSGIRRRSASGLCVIDTNNKIPSRFTSFVYIVY